MICENCGKEYEYDEGIVYDSENFICFECLEEKAKERQEKKNAEIKATSISFTGINLVNENHLINEDCKIKKEIIVCSCGCEFEGLGRCPKCLKSVVSPMSIEKEHKPCPSYIERHYEENRHKMENHL